MTSGAGNAAVWNETTRAVDVTLASAGYVVRQSYLHVPYQLGRPQRILLTGNFGNLAAVTRERGQMDANNGVFWQRKPDGAMAVGVRSSASGTLVNTIFDAADWNGERVTFNPAHNNVYIIEYVWLGAFAVRWGIATATGVKYVHTAIFADELATSYMQTANLPLRDAVYADSDPAAPATMQVVCASVESEGGYFTNPAVTFAARRRISAAIAAGTAPAEAPVVAIRPALLSGTIPNRSTILIDEVTVYATAAVDWSLWYFAPGVASPLTGGSWAAVGAVSSVEMNASATAINLADGVLIAAGVAVASGAGGSARGVAATQITQTLPLTIDACGANNPLASNVGANPAHLILTASGTGNVSGLVVGRQV
jgi:hypothetical protein